AAACALPYCAFRTCPRISPSGYFSVWMLKYQLFHLPPEIAWSCCALKTTDPLIGLASPPLIGTTGGALSPRPAVGQERGALVRRGHGNGPPLPDRSGRHR